MPIDKAMAMDPRARYTSAAEVANELADFLAKRPTTLDRSRALQVALWSRRNPQLAVTIVAILGLAGGVVGTHMTVTNLQEERVALDQRVKKQKAEKEIGALDKKLNNPDFVSRAPEEVVAEIRQRLADEKARMQVLVEALETLGVVK